MGAQHLDVRRGLSMVCSACVTRRKLQTPGNAEEHNRKETPTINPINRQNLTDQAPSTTERKAWETHNTN